MIIEDWDGWDHVVGWVCMIRFELPKVYGFLSCGLLGYGPTVGGWFCIDGVLGRSLVTG